MSAPHSQEDKIVKTLINHFQDQYDITNFVPEKNYDHYAYRGYVDLFAEVQNTDGVAVHHIIEVKSESAVIGATGANEIIRQFERMRNYFYKGTEYDTPDTVQFQLIFESTSDVLYHLNDNFPLYSEALSPSMEVVEDTVMYSSISVSTPIKSNQAKTADEDAIPSSEEVYGLDYIYADAPVLLTNSTQNARTAHQHNIPCISVTTDDLETFAEEVRRRINPASVLIIVLDDKAHNGLTELVVRDAPFLESLHPYVRVIELPVRKYKLTQNLSNFLHSHGKEEFLQILSSNLSILPQYPPQSSVVTGQLSYEKPFIPILGQKAMALGPTGFWESLSDDDFDLKEELEDKIEEQLN